MQSTIGRALLYFLPCPLQLPLLETRKCNLRCTGRCVYRAAHLSHGLFAALDLISFVVVRLGNLQFSAAAVICDRNQLCITKGITIITRYIRRQCQFGNNLKKARKRRKKGTRNRRSRRPPNRGTRTQPSRCADRPRGPAGAPGTQQSG